jgi:hypothetical protein
MDADSAQIRAGAPYLFTDARAGDGIDAVVAHFERSRAAWLARDGEAESAEWGGRASAEPPHDHRHADVGG